MRTCGVAASEAVHFRARAASPDESDTSLWILATGHPAQRPDEPCGTDYLRYAWVKIKSAWDGIIKGVATYQHLQLSSSSFSIYFRGGASFTGAHFNSVQIGATVSDAPAGKDCWDGWHVHENNKDTVLWDSWNLSYYNLPSDRCECHRVDIKETWTRRLHWLDS
jgi:hypothetical protein